MTDEIEPERIEELLRAMEGSKDHVEVQAILSCDLPTFGELRTLIRCYQRVRGLREDIKEEVESLRTFDNVCKAIEDVPRASLPRDIYESQVSSWYENADRAIRGEEGHE